MCILLTAVLLILTSCTALTWENRQGEPAPRAVVYQCEQDAAVYAGNISGGNSIMYGTEEVRRRFACMNQQGYYAKQ